MWTVARPSPARFRFIATRYRPVVTAPEWLASPNFTERRDGYDPGLIVLHHTAMESAEAALARLRDPDAGVSAHYVIGETGRTWQLVAEDMRAWHAGAGEWHGRGDVNSPSIGIELVSSGRHPFAWPQMLRLEVLMQDIMTRWRIPPEGVIAHSDMAPVRKSDPGVRFDWRALALRGLSVWPDPGAGRRIADPAGFADSARAFGYPRDVDAEALLMAFRLRFRPWASGPADAVDAALADDLSRR